ncbi:Putative beta-lactamase-inhibitor-like, PepSY-like [Chitinophaga jiangningensis]|uniref:Putative beta-lactamase-inhibitor-like, PepSY-like n=1 Tax=Chitinophaga jiangningensis TaxID=1419482 RepID=A0A1M7DTN8_9BACT|nr:PepSY-like domain-containing protein [Chitinophaga jiangningensis]SHL82826.1 Putative beta-lactamase-inhibitor-like, PepSY-like [Chitinophaga jiangningensis]
MKKLTLIFCAVLVSSGITFAQQKKSVKKTKTVTHKVEAPVAVKSSFEQNFAGTTDAKWTKTSAGFWNVSFLKENIKTVAQYNADGGWISTRSEYNAQSLPESVSTTLKTKYPEATIKDGWKIERADVAAYYKVNIQDNGADKAVLLNDAGTITE